MHRSFAPLRILFGLLLAVALCMFLMSQREEAGQAGLVVDEGALLSSDGADAGALLEGPEQQAATGALDRSLLRQLDVRGLVLDQESGEAVPDCTAILWSSAGMHMRRKTAADGRFTLSLPPNLNPREAWVEVLVPDDWSIEESTLDLLEDSERALEAAGFEPRELLFEARRDPLVPIYFQLIDAEDAGIVADYELIFRHPGGGSEHATSDSQGRIRTHSRFPLGRALYNERDHPLMPAQPFLRMTDLGRVAEAQAPPRLVVHPGPTFQLDLGLPDGLSPRRLEAVFAAGIDAYAGGTALGKRAPLRGKAGAFWVRFPSLAHLYQKADAPFWLQIIDSAGEWYGAARVDTLRGSSPTRARISLARLGRLEGIALSTGSEGNFQAASDVQIRLEPERAGLFEGIPRPKIADQRTGANGIFSFRGLFPGAYRLRAMSGSHGLAQRVVSVQGGETQQVELALESVPTGKLGGRLSSSTGGFHGLAAIHLEPLDAIRGALEQSLPLLWTREESGFTASFHFGEIPLGEYRLSVRGATSSFLVEPESVKVRPGQENLQFRVRDDLMSEAEARAVESTQGRLLIRYRVDDDDIHQATFDGASFLLSDRVRAGHPLRWVVLAEGRRPVYGRESDLVHIPGSDSLGVRIVRSELEPGWGKIVDVRTEGGLGLADVSIFLDGMVTSRTWADGRTVVGADNPPEFLRVELSGWREVGRQERAQVISVTLARGE